MLVRQNFVLEVEMRDVSDQAVTRAGVHRLVLAELVRKDCFNHLIDRVIRIGDGQRGEIERFVDVLPNRWDELDDVLTRFDHIGIEQHLLMRLGHRLQITDVLQRVQGEQRLFPLGRLDEFHGYANAGNGDRLSEAIAIQLSGAFQRLGQFEMHLTQRVNESSRRNRHSSVSERVGRGWMVFYRATAAGIERRNGS